MRRRLPRRWPGCALWILAASVAFADVGDELELQAVKARYDATEYREALARAERFAAREGAPRAQRAEAHRLAALAAFHLGELDTADEHFRSLLQLEPDAAIDPFAAPPAALRHFEQVRARSDALVREARERLALELERSRTPAPQAPLPLAEPSAARPAVATPALGAAAGVGLPPVPGATSPARAERPASGWSALLPFGLAQLAQGRTSSAAAVGSVHAALAVASVVTFWMHRAIGVEATYGWTDRATRDGRFAVTLVGVPQDRATEASVLRWVSTGAGIAFYVAWALGSLEALLSQPAQRPDPGRIAATGPRALAPPRAAFGVTTNGFAFSLDW